MNTYDATPDQAADGISQDGEKFSIARFGTLVLIEVIDANGHVVADDLQCASEAEAESEFHHHLSLFVGDGN